MPGPTARFASTFSTYSITPRTLGLAEGVLKGDRLSLSRAITLIESTKESHRLEAEALLDHVVRERSRRAGKGRRQNTSSVMACGSDSSSSGDSLRKGSRPLRIGIAGPPGAGKSTFIESLGMYLLNSKGLVRFKRTDREIGRKMEIVILPLILPSDFTFVPPPHPTARSRHRRRPLLKSQRRFHLGGQDTDVRAG